MKRVVFIDRDGTIIREPADEQVDSLEKLEWIPGIIGGLKMLTDAGFTLVMVTNQDGLGSRRYPRTSFDAVQGKIIRLLNGEGVRFEKIFVCPHRPVDHCACRKPATGLLKTYLSRNRIDRGRSFVLGDRETDVLFAENLGVRAVRLSADGSGRRAEYRTRYAADACRYMVHAVRTATIHRMTSETSIMLRCVLDGDGTADISTGIGFFDHMLEQLARHSGMNLTLSVRGDLHIDEHHTIEDTGIALGTAIREALGSKRGIGRFGFWAPLDESLGRAVIDLGGRSYCSVNCTFRRERVGAFPTELVEDFFRGFADGLKANIHCSCTGRNDHHKIEALFKAVARALRPALALDVRKLAILPTTKGLL